MESDWTVFAKASLAIYFKSVASGLEFAFTTDKLETTAPLSDSNYVNLRVIGPKITPITQETNRVSAVVQLLVHLIKNPENIYDAEFYKGKFNVACYGCIPFMDSGFPDSTQEILGFLQLQRIPDPVSLIQLTPADPTSRAVEFIITAPYEILI